MTMLPPDDGRFARLERIMEKGFNDVQQTLERFDARLRSLENAETGNKVALDLRVTNAERRIDEYNGCIKELENKIDWITPWVKGARWLVGLLGGSVFILIWGLITGQIQLIFIK